MPDKKTATFFDLYANDFDAIYGEKHTFLNRLINEYLRKSMKVRFGKTIDGCSPIYNKSVLDIGCGSGLYGVTLAKMGARQICGIDFAEGMLALANQRAKDAGVDQKCDFRLADFMQHELKEKFDYAIIMGVMDYIKDPHSFINKVLLATTAKAFFTFPLSKGFLAWQRRMRYSRRCDLYMYTEAQLQALFIEIKCKKFVIERIYRDYFVTVYLHEGQTI